MPKPYVVFLNGPPGSGKDYAAATLVEQPDITISHYKFSDPIKDMACALLEIERGTLEKTKGLIYNTYGVTLRRILIDMSEKFMKPCYGNDIFGRICTERMAEEIQYNDVNEEEQPDLFVISDSGFDKEAEHVLQLFGKDNALLIRLHREGHSFEGDSRSYIELPDVRTIDLYNHGDDLFGVNLIKLVKDWMEEKNNA